MSAAALDEAGWDRAWDRGYQRGAADLKTAIVYIETANQLLELCRVPDRDRRAIWSQALSDCDREYGDLPATTRRALAARRIALLIARRLRKEQRE